MGNNRSNDSRKTNYKTYKITKVEKDENDSWFRLHLDDYVKYQSDRQKHIDLDKICFLIF